MQLPDTTGKKRILQGNVSFAGRKATYPILETKSVHIVEKEINTSETCFLHYLLIALLHLVSLVVKMRQKLS